MLHLTAEELLKQACCALKNLSCNNNENRIRIGQAGGIEQILHTMQEQLLEQACGALVNLSGDNDKERRIGQAGGLKVLADTMGRNSTATNVQNFATRCTT